VPELGCNGVQTDLDTAIATLRNVELWLL